MRQSQWRAERWLLRYVRLCGFAVAGSETFDAAVRAGAADDQLVAALAMIALMRLGLLRQASGILFLTDEGFEAAQAALGHADQLEDPPVPLPDRCLPRTVWCDADWEPVDAPEGNGMLAPRREEVPMAYNALPETERFSLDDPEAGRKLVANLDRRGVRLDFSEVCVHFDCTTYEEKTRLRDFLIGLEAQGEIVEVLPDLYCRPAMKKGKSGEADAPMRNKKQRKGLTAERDRDAERLMEFACGLGTETVTTKELIEGGRKLRFTENRTTYLITHLRTIKQLLNGKGRGVYILARQEPKPTSSDGVA